MTCRECAKFDKCGGKLCATKYYDAVMAVDNVDALCCGFYPKPSITERFIGRMLTKIKRRLEYVSSTSKKDCPRLTVFISHGLYKLLKRCPDGTYAVIGAADDIIKLYGYDIKVYDEEVINFYICEDEGYYRSSDKKEDISTTDFCFPLSVGDTVKCFVEDENHVADILEYTVHGLAIFNGKKYVITKDGQLNEIGTADCILPQRR